jgi:hypothetical protein
MLQKSILFIKPAVIRVIKKQNIHMKLAILFICTFHFFQTIYCQTALTGISVNNPYADVKKFGAVGDGRTDDTKPVQDCFNSLSLNGGGCIIISPGEYKVTKLCLPKLKSGQVVIIGYGATLKSTTNDTILIRKPVNQAEALDKLTNSAIIIEGLKFKGNNGNAQVGLYIGGSFNSLIKNCNFSGLNNGFELRFGLMTEIDNCSYDLCNNAGLIIDTGNGQWPGATVFNCQSNATTINNCHFYNKKNQDYSIYTQNCSDLQFNNIVIEGYNPKVGLYIGSNTTVFKGLVLNGLHNECKESDAMIKMAIPAYSGGMFKFSYIYNQMDVVLIDASQSSGCLIIVDMILYMTSASSFKKGDVKWAFYNNNNMWDPKQTKYWDNNTLPKNMVVY